MPNEEAKAQAVADKITARARESLSGVDREMSIMKWPAEFRAIMWDAVAALASQRAAEARASQ